MTDTSSITLHHRDPETHAVFLRWNGGVGWGEPQETAEWHEEATANPAYWASAPMHAELAVMRRALDAAEAAGVDIGGTGHLTADWYPGGVARTESVNDDSPILTPRYRAAAYLLREVRPLLDDPEALAALPYDVRDHRTPAQEPEVLGVKDRSGQWEVSGPTPFTVDADLDGTDEPVSGEHPPVTARDLADSRDPVTLPNYSGTPSPTFRRAAQQRNDMSRGFPPAPAAATDTPEEQARKLLEYHTRRDAGGCACGWNVWGASFGQHLVATLAASGLLHGDRERQEVEELQREKLNDSVFKVLRRKVLDVIREAIPDRESDGLMSGVRQLVAQRDEAWARIEQLTADPEDGTTDQPPTSDVLAVALNDMATAVAEYRQRQLDALAQGARVFAAAMRRAPQTGGTLTERAPEDLVE